MCCKISINTAQQRFSPKVQSTSQQVKNIACLAGRTSGQLVHWQLQVLI